jgi:uncharacterized protein YaaR (DUF327 family)
MTRGPIWGNRNRTKFHDRQSSERCIRKLISRHCLEKTRTRWNDFLFLITDDRDFRPETWTQTLKSVIMNDTGPHLGKSKQNQEISEFKILVGTNFIRHIVQGRL